MIQKEKSERELSENKFSKKLTSFILALLFGYFAEYDIFIVLPSIYTYIHFSFTSQNGCPDFSIELALFFIACIIFPLLAWGLYSLFVNAFVKQSSLKYRKIVGLLCIVILLIFLVGYLSLIPSLPDNGCPTIH